MGGYLNDKLGYDWKYSESVQGPFPPYTILQTENQAQTSVVLIRGTKHSAAMFGQKCLCYQNLQSACDAKSKLDLFWIDGYCME